MLAIFARIVMASASAVFLGAFLWLSSFATFPQLVVVLLRDLPLSALYSSLMSANG